MTIKAIKILKISTISLFILATSAFISLMILFASGIVPSCDAIGALCFDTEVSTVRESRNTQDDSDNDSAANIRDDVQTGHDFTYDGWVNHTYQQGGETYSFYLKPDWKRQDVTIGLIGQAYTSGTLNLDLYNSEIYMPVGEELIASTSVVKIQNGEDIKVSYIGCNPGSYSKAFAEYDGISIELNSYGTGFGEVGCFEADSDLWQEFEQIVESLKRY